MFKNIYYYQVRQTLGKGHLPVQNITNSHTRTPTCLHNRTHADKDVTNL